MDIIEVEESNLVTHARRELELAGLFDETSDYGGMLGDVILDVVMAFAGQGHSGYSAAITIELVTRLLQFENLTPLTNDPAEWFDHTDISSGQPLYQSTRCSEAFSNDGGVTYYLLSEEPREMHISLIKELS